MQVEYCPKDIERIERAWSDGFARERGWNDYLLDDPTDDLCLFFESLPGKKMLDVGCGWGRYVYWFIDQKLIYSGLDHSIEMLKVALENNRGSHFLQASFLALPAPANYFDGLWSCCSLAGVPKKNLTEVLQEHRRVMKHGAVMMIIMPSLQVSKQIISKDYQGKLKTFQAYYLLNEFEGFVERAGFEILKAGERSLHRSFFVLVKKPITR